MLGVTSRIPHLVDLVKKDQRVTRTSLHQSSDDPSRHSSSVGPSMATHLSLVSNAS